MFFGMGVMLLRKKDILCPGNMPVEVKRTVVLALSISETRTPLYHTNFSTSYTTD
jgi:hypothetical protein